MDKLEEILSYMKENIEYGYIDIHGNKHVKDLKGFRPIYRISSVEDTIKNKLGTCIEQVALMNYFCAKSNIKSKMFCTRIYEPNEFDDMNADEHLHCFILAYVNGKVYHIEHPNWYNIGIFQYDNEAEAIEKIQEYFNDISNGQARPLAQYNEEKVGCSFNEFNCYINSLKEYELKG